MKIISQKHSDYKRNIKKLFPYSADVPHGFKTHLQEYCAKNLGPPYITWYGFGAQRRGSFVVNESAIWAYNSEDGRLYVKDESNIGMIAMAILTKRKK